MAKGIEAIIESEKAKLKSTRNSVTLTRPCTLDDGIIAWDDMKVLSSNESMHRDISFFVPASGAGSRMFAFLYDFQQTGLSNEQVDRFFQNLSAFPFFAALNVDSKEDYATEERLRIIDRLLNDPNFQFGERPKGMIPFFLERNEMVTPFQLQAKQALELLNDQPKIHFTVKSGQEKAIEEHIRSSVGDDIAIEFSWQDLDTDAFCFDENGDIVVDSNGQPLRRPAGHGALLTNLNQVDADIVLIKNIDNVQFGEKAKTSFDSWNQMLVVLDEFNSSLKEAINSNSFEMLASLHDRFMFLSSSEFERIQKTNTIAALGDRPTRVCGMVVNQGKPGGGPFWIDENGVESKQIIEKSQINIKDERQLKILEASTHFNPVFIAAFKQSLNTGERLDLMKFTNEDLYLNVAKPNNGEMVHYSELPGLWNGGMHNWNTIFVEIPVEAFTPVKTVLDLL